MTSAESLVRIPVCGPLRTFTAPCIVYYLEHPPMLQRSLVSGTETTEARLAFGPEGEEILRGEWEKGDEDDSVGGAQS